MSAAPPTQASGPLRAPAGDRGGAEAPGPTAVLAAFRSAVKGQWLWVAPTVATVAAVVMCGSLPTTTWRPCWHFGIIRIGALLMECMAKAKICMGKVARIC